VQSKWFKNDEQSRVWWLDNSDEKTGVFIFSFDKKKEYNLFSDYPHKLSNKEKKIFKEDEPFWAEFFKERKNKRG
jgi:hypothetical protein